MMELQACCLGNSSCTGTCSTIYIYIYILSYFHANLLSSVYIDHLILVPIFSHSILATVSCDSICFYSLVWNECGRLFKSASLSADDGADINKHCVTAKYIMNVYLFLQIFTIVEMRQNVCENPRVLALAAAESQVKACVQQKSAFTSIVRATANIYRHLFTSTLLDSTA